MLMALFIGVNWGGFRLWHYSQESWQSRLGKGLLLLGGLLLGANLGLMSQMFHRSDPVFHLFLVWGLGVWLMAYSLRLTLLGRIGDSSFSLGIWGRRYYSSCFGESNRLAVSDRPFPHTSLSITVAFGLPMSVQMAVWHERHCRRYCP